MIVKGQKDGSWLLLKGNYLDFENYKMRKRNRFLYKCLLIIQRKSYLRIQRKKKSPNFIDSHVFLNKNSVVRQYRHTSVNSV